MVAFEDWITAVTPRPKRNAFKGVPVMRSMAFFRGPEELAFKPSPIMRIP